MAWLVLLTACGGGRAGAPDAQTMIDTAPVGAVLPVPDTTYPTARRGALLARPALPGPIGGEWVATAGLCPEPPTFHLLAPGDSLDLMIVLRSPSEGWTTGTYLVASPEDTTDAPGTARIGLQRVSYVDQSYQGARGQIELSRLDRLVSGRFDVALRDLNSQDTVRYLGVFDRIPVDSLPPAECQAAARGIPPGVR
jgi:hypothetical protein